MGFREMTGGVSPSRMFYSAIRITSSGWVASCSRVDFCFTLTYRVLPSAESAQAIRERWGLECFDDFIAFRVDHTHFTGLAMSHVGFITRWVEQHGQGFRRGDFCQYIAITGIDYQHFRRFRVGDKCAVARCVQAQVDKEMLFPVIQQFFAAENFVSGGVNGNEFTVGIGGVQAF